MLKCGDPSRGFFCYYCVDCDEYYIAHFRCNGRICTRCGARYVNEWAKKTVGKMLDVDHSHIVFTLPDDIWPLIKDNDVCIKELSAAAFRVVQETMSRSAKQNVTPGMIDSLQTYGKALNYNVHFHTVVTDGGITKKANVWKPVYYIPYDIMRIKWKRYSLDIILKHVDKTQDNQILLYDIYYHRYRNGFNLRRIKARIPKKELVMYIARYVRHPAISNRRIVNYDGKTVTIVCEDEEKRIKWYPKFTVEEFITRLIQHIPKKNFKLIRYYGIYSRRKNNNKVPIKKDKQESITKYFVSKHSINCPRCDKILYPIFYFPPYSDRGPPSGIVFGERIIDYVS